MAQINSNKNSKNIEPRNNVLYKKLMAQTAQMEYDTMHNNQ
jgi:hypothetical protein